MTRPIGASVSAQEGRAVAEVAADPQVRDLLCAFRTVAYWQGRFQQPSWSDVDAVEAHIVKLEREVLRLETENRHLRAEVYE